MKPSFSFLAKEMLNSAKFLILTKVFPAKLNLTLLHSSSVNVYNKQINAFHSKMVTYCILKFKIAMFFGQCFRSVASRKHFSES